MESLKKKELNVMLLGSELPPGQFCIGREK